MDPFTATRTKVTSRDIVICHDLGPITHPRLFSATVQELYKQAYKEIVQRDPYIVFVSNASRLAYVETFGTPTRSGVIYPPVRVDLDSLERRPVEGISSPFLLTVGSLGERKNQVASIRAFARSGLAEDGVSLVLCGSKEPGHEQVVMLAREVPGVLVLPYVTDAELAWLYDNSRGFVLVSKLEGFGMPVAEAISRNLIPLVTASSVLHEVAGDGAIVVKDDDIDEMASGMRALVEMSDAERARRLVELKQSIARFTRQEFAESWRQLMRAM